MILVDEKGAAKDGFSVLVSKKRSVQADALTRYCETVELRQKNHAALKLYRFCDYRSIARHRSYYYDNDDVIIDGKVLGLV